MSGFAGLLYLDGRTVDPAVMGAMMQAMAARGTDGEGAWRSGAVALGHRWRRTGASQHGAQFFIDTASGSVIACDARLDNRSDLLAPCGTRPQTGDAELILRAYERWGLDCPAHLLGDFAFILWDLPHRRVVCARDPFGVKPCYYHAGTNHLAAASSIRALLAVPGVPRRINEQMVADELLSDFRFDYRDPEATYFADIKQLRPAHVLWVEDGRVQTRQYWNADPDAQIAYRRPEEYFEHFAELFRDAIRCRMADAAPTVGVALSGGIDSTLVTATAERLRINNPDLPALQAFTMPFGGIYQEEWQAIRRLQQWYGTPVREIELSGGPVALFELFACRTETPHYYGFCNNAAFYRTVASGGCRVLLTGFGADELLASAEVGQLHDLLGQGRLLSLGREIRRRAWIGNDDPSLVALDLLKDLIPAPARWALRHARGLQVPPWINRTFAHRVRMGRWRSGQPRQRFRTQCQEHSYRAVTSPAMAMTLNQADDVAAAHGLEWRYPYLDRRLVEFFLSVPTAIKRRAGYRKRFGQVALQQETHGVLRDQVGEDAREPLRADPENRTLEARRFEECLDAAGEPLWRMVDEPRIRALAHEYAGGHIGVRSTVWKLASLACWIHGFFPSPNGHAGTNGHNGGEG